MSEKQTNERKSLLLRALDTVERVGNGLPNPATIFLILTGVVIVLSALCAALGVSVTYDYLDSATGEITQKTVNAVSLMDPDSIRHMVTTVVSNFTSFFALQSVYNVISRARHDLYDKSARLSHCVVLVHKHAKCYR